MKDNATKDKAQTKPETMLHTKLIGTGPVRVKVLGGVVSPKKGLPTVFLEVKGFPVYLSLPATSWCDVFAGQVGQTFTVVAELVDGEPVLTRVGDDKWRQVDEPPGQAAPAAAGAVGEPAAPAEFLPVPKEQSEAWTKAKHLVGRNASLAALALRKAARLADDWAASTRQDGQPRGPMPGELLAAVYGTMLYGANAGLPVLNLPVSVDYQTLEIVPKKAKK